MIPRVVLPLLFLLLLPLFPTYLSITPNCSSLTREIVVKILIYLRCWRHTASLPFPSLPFQSLPSSPWRVLHPFPCSPVYFLTCPPFPRYISPYLAFLQLTTNFPLALSLPFFLLGLVYRGLSRGS